MEIERLVLPDVVPQEEVKAYKNKIAIVGCGPISSDLAEFIDAVAAELGDFERESTYTVMISGVELRLANIEQIADHIIDPATLYPLEVPVMKVVNRRAEMYRIYHNRGRKGLEDYLKAKTSRGRELIEILNMHVFKK